jgi:hypothetical protein
MKQILNSTKALFVSLLLSKAAIAQTFSDNNKRFVSFQQESFAITKEEEPLRKH